MKKSTDKNFPKIDYSKLPEEVEKIVEHKKEKIERKASITFDGRQFLVRIPTEISRIMEIAESDKFSFEVEMPLPKAKEKPQLSVKLVRDKNE